MLALGDWLEATTDRPFNAELTMRDRLQALGDFDPIFREPGFVFAALCPATTQDGLIQMGGYIRTEQAERFCQAVYEKGWMRPFD